MGDREKRVSVLDELGYIIGKSVLHLPANPLPPPADRPGHGLISHSRCKLLSGGVYSRRVALLLVVNGHVCSTCIREHQFSILSDDELAPRRAAAAVLRSPLERRLGKPLGR